MPTALYPEEPMTQVPPALPEAVKRGARSHAAWAERTVKSRLEVLRHARHLLALNADKLAATIHLPRTTADTLVAEVLPLLAAIRFLEREAATILAPRALGRRGLPLWLSGLSTTIERVPLGRILILAPYNYPLLLPGVQCMQALAAGNSVVWKPGAGGAPVARLFARILAEAGLPEGLLRVTDDTVAAAEAELAEAPDKIVFTGSADTGRKVLHHAAETLTPVVAELSGADAVLVLPSADPQLVADALLFGLRLNGSQTCMAPRRLIFVGAAPGQQILDRLIPALRALPATPHPAPLAPLLLEAVALGATHVGDRNFGPAVLLNATPEMRVTHTDLFHPVLSILHAKTPEHAVEIHNASSLSLTAAIFGQSDGETAQLARGLRTGTVLINDLIVPTADPRVPFGGRARSGFGLTRGREGLLELTTTKTITRRTNRSYRHFQPTTERHAPFFTALIHLLHAPTWRERFTALRTLVTTARTLNQPQEHTQ